jgi:hypothetical protein
LWRRPRPKLGCGAKERRKKIPTCRKMWKCHVDRNAEDIAEDCMELETCGAKNKEKSNEKLER